MSKYFIAQNTAYKPILIQLLLLVFHFDRLLPVMDGSTPETDFCWSHSAQ